MTSATDNGRSSRWGQFFFTTMSHRLYDAGLYGFVTRYLWRCSTERLLDNYVENISRNHLEIGVGSGFFLERTLCSDYLRRLVLLDLNGRCLRKSAARLQAFDPETRQHDMLEPIPAELGKFDSVAMNYVLHCIPGSFRSNRRMFASIRSRLTSGGVLFGATLVRRPIKEGLFAWLLMWLLNAIGVFGNTRQTVNELRYVLGSLFDEVDLYVAGNAVVFRAIK